MKVSFDLPDIYNASQDEVRTALAHAEESFLGHFTHNSDRPESNNLVLRNYSNSQSLTEQQIEAIAREVIRNEFVNVNNDVVKQSEYAFGMPNDTQFEKIMRYLPSNVGSKIKQQDLVTSSFVASNNFIWWSYGAWTPNSLADMAMQYPSKPFIIDHNTWSVKHSRGMVYDTEIVINKEVDERILEAVNGELNYEIFQKEGYIELIAKVAFQASSLHVDDLRFGRVKKVSTGCYVDTDSFQCPIDGTYFGDGDKWYECAEGHTLPHWYLAYWVYSDDEIDNMAPYYMIDRVIDTEELSQVHDGNLPAATLIIDR